MQPTNTPRLLVDVEIYTWNGDLFHAYQLDWNNGAQRAVFAQQADAALRNKQQVYTAKSEKQ